MVIDTDHLERATAGDRALQTELLLLFRDQLGAASAPWGDADAEAGLHRLKGASYAVGATALAAALAEAEAALQRGVSAAALDDAVPQLRILLHEAREAVDGLVAAPRSGGLAKPSESG